MKEQQRQTQMEQLTNTLFNILDWHPLDAEDCVYVSASLFATLVYKFTEKGKELEAFDKMTIMMRDKIQEFCLKTDCNPKQLS